jgi:hypothetical protein
LDVDGLASARSLDVIAACFVLRDDPSAHDPVSDEGATSAQHGRSVGGATIRWTWRSPNPQGAHMRSSYQGVRLSTVDYRRDGSDSQATLNGLYDLAMGRRGRGWPGGGTRPWFRLTRRIGNPSHPERPGWPKVEVSGGGVWGQCPTAGLTGVGAAHARVLGCWRVHLRGRVTPADERGGTVPCERRRLPGDALIELEVGLGLLREVPVR